MFKQSRINDMTIANWLTELSFLTDAGIPLVTSIQVLAESHLHKTFSQLLLQLLTQLKQGASLSESLKPHPQYFSPLILQVIHLSEHSGQLSKGLKLIAKHLNTKQALKKNILHALTYPTILVGTGLISTAWILIYMIPQFAELFLTQQTELPASSRFIFALSRLLTQQYDLCLVAIALVGIFLYALYKQKHLSTNFLCKIPAFKKLYMQQQLLHFSQSLTLCLQAGLPIRQALMLSCPSDDPLKTDTLHCIQQIEVGHSLHQSMQQCTSFPDLLLHMIELGEQTGKLDTILERFSEHLNQSLAARLKQLTQLIEPLIILGLGVLIGGLVISIYLPIFKLGSTL